MSFSCWDISRAFRQLNRDRKFAATAIITLAVGIGANTAIFSVLYSVLLRPLPYDNSSQLVWLTIYLPKLNDHIVGTPDFLAWREQQHSFTDLGAYSEGDFNLTGGTGTVPERVHYASITPSLLRVLAIQPQIGRAFADQEDTPGAVKVAILSYGFWQRHFGGDSSILAKRIVLDGVPFDIVGVMPAKFAFPDLDTVPDILIPLSIPEHIDIASQPIQIIKVIGRLRSAQLIGQARSELSGIQTHLVDTYPAEFKNMMDGFKTQVVLLQDHVVIDIRRTLLMLSGAGLFLLLVACANTANLQLGKSIERAKELAIRVAMGASVVRLTCQSAIESFATSVCAGFIGTFIAASLIWGLQRLRPPELPQSSHIGVNYSILIFAFVSAAVCGVLAGLVPTALIFRTNVSDILKDSSHTVTDTPTVRRVRSLLVVGEVSLATILLLGSGLFIRSFIALLHVNPGFDASHLLTLQISLPDSKYTNLSQQRTFFDELTRRLKTAPAVQDVGAVSQLPLTSYRDSASVVFEGRIAPPRGMRPQVITTSATPDYFRTMRIPLVRGRYFDATDQGGVDVILVNQSFAQRFFSNEDPIGKRIQIGAASKWMTIVGIVGDIRNVELRTVPSPEIFTNFLQSPNSEMFVVARSVDDPALLSTTVREQVLAIDSEQPIFDVATMEQRFGSSIGAQRFNTWLLTAFGTIAAVLSIMGIYGIVSLFVIQRIREIGVRMALGACRRDIVKLVFIRGIVPTLVGVAVGTTAALMMARFAATMLFGVRPTDFATFLIVSVALLAAASLASYFPAKRAAMADPIVILKNH